VFCFSRAFERGRSFIQKKPTVPSNGPICGLLRMEFRAHTLFQIVLTKTCCIILFLEIKSLILVFFSKEPFIVQNRLEITQIQTIMQTNSLPVNMSAFSNQEKPKFIG
jgi:hypothetical protein